MFDFIFYVFRNVVFVFEYYTTLLVSWTRWMEIVPISLLIRKIMYILLFQCSKFVEKHFLIKMHFLLENVTFIQHVLLIPVSLTKLSIPIHDSMDLHLYLLAAITQNSEICLFNPFVLQKNVWIKTYLTFW